MIGHTMKTRYKYLHFVKVKTSMWECRSNKTSVALGNIYWDDYFRQYSYSPDLNTVYSASCLDDIADFVRQLKQHGMDL